MLLFEPLLFEEAVAHGRELRARALARGIEHEGRIEQLATIPRAFHSSAVLGKSPSATFTSPIACGTSWVREQVLGLRLHGQTFSWAGGASERT